MIVAKMLLILSISVVVSGCIHNGGDTVKIRESVMTKGMIICADFEEKVCVMAENSQRKMVW
jgi:hypothetical protein